MIRAICAAIVVLLVLPGVLSAQEKPIPALSEVQRLKADNYALTEANLNLQKQQLAAQVKEADERLAKMKADLEAEFVKTLGCAAGFDWKALACAPKPEPAKK